jgi:hypothetical protein
MHKLHAWKMSQKRLMRMQRTLGRTRRAGSKIQKRRVLSQGIDGCKGIGCRREQCMKITNTGFHAINGKDQSQIVQTPLDVLTFGMLSRAVTIAVAPLLARRYSNASLPNNVNKGTAMRPAL